MGISKWVRNVGFATLAKLGAQSEGERGGGTRIEKFENSKTRGRKRPSTSRVAMKAKGMRRLWRRESLLSPRQPGTHRRRRKEMEVQRRTKIPDPPIHFSGPTNFFGPKIDFTNHQF
jgi:hypothetical protein